MRDVIRPHWTSALPPQDSTEAAAHVDLRLRRHGDEAWRRDQIECTGWSAELRGFAGTIDTVVQKALTLARL